MKPALNWMKANMAIVVLSAVIILILPLAFVGSSYWNGRIRKARTDEATKALNDLNALKVNYTLPSPVPGGTPITVDADAPHPELTRFFREKKQELEKQVGQVVTIAEEVNKRQPLMEGVFPAPSSQVKTLEFAAAIIGVQGRPSAYDTLLKSINAGGPTDHVSLAESLTEIRNSAMEKVRSDSGREQLSAEEQEALTKELVGRRLGAYRQHANGISLYATTDILPPDVPRVMPDQQPDVETCFRWQWDYWAIETMVRAIGHANSQNGKSTPLPQSIVKRIERISLDPINFTPPDPNASMSGQPAAAPVSMTGRQSGGGNGLYDIRNGELTLIVASARIPELMNAISSSDLITITGLSIEDIDEWTDLENGYFYGTEHVVRVRMPVEMVMLRSWTVPFMPESIKSVVTNAAPVMDMAAAAPPPPPPPPSAAPAKGKAPKKGKKSTKRPTPKGGDDGGFGGGL